MFSQNKNKDIATMSTTSNTRNVLICIDGTLSSMKTPNNRLGHFASQVIGFRDAILPQIYRFCTDKHIYYFDGPGSDIFDDDSAKSSIQKVFGTIGGCLDGHLGDKNVHKTFAEILEKLETESAEAKKKKKSLVITIVSYSRGGYVAWLIKEKVKEKCNNNELDVASLYMFNIDPVRGTLVERIGWYMSPVPTKRTQQSTSKATKLPIFSYSFYSDSGNPKYWPFHFNTPGFSAMDLDDEDHYSEKFLFKANHDEIAGRSLEDFYHPERIVGNIVMYLILNRCVLNFSKSWKPKALERGERSIMIYSAQNPTPKMNRKHLRHDNLKSCLVGECKTDLVTNISSQKTLRSR